MTTMAPLPAPAAPCTEPACLTATPGLPCRCTCDGVGHGHHTNTDRATAAEANRDEHLRRLAVMGGIVTTDDEVW